MMKLLANENIPCEAIERLRGKGPDISWAREISSGMTDVEVIKLALSEKRILLTPDKDFGELAHHRGAEASCGVILLRLRIRSASAVTEMLSEILKKNINWHGHFASVSENGVRLLPLLKGF